MPIVCRPEIPQEPAEKSLGHSTKPKVVVTLKGCTPLVPARTSQQDYNESVRYYTTKAMNGGTTFKCTLCEHGVSTLDFSITNGNRRTQAAAAINQHAALLHLRPPLPNPKPLDQFRLGSRFGRS